jgi:predicted enzyme related to lactoylglutathione lyase
MPVTLTLVVIRVSDLDRAQQFYQALGLTFTREQHGSGPAHLAHTSDGTVFELYPSGHQSLTSGVRLGFRVASVHAALAALTMLGGEVASAPMDGPWGPRAVVIDPDGNRVEITQDRESTC